VNLSDCWAAGSGPGILATTDGGTTWTSQAAEGELGAVACADSSNCWAVGAEYDNNSPTGYNAVIDKTTDGGNTWISQQVPSGAYPYSLSSASCISTTDCWVTGRTRHGRRDYQLRLVVEWHSH
jgi:photosystem II stability/assembly factor-like uncharacterized protein